MIEPRGPKARTAENSRQGSAEVIHRDDEASPSELNPPAQKEYDRLIEVLRSKGSLDRVDLVCVAECARVKELLDRAHRQAAKRLVWQKAKLIGLLSSHHRGRLRELGLTTAPCRSLIRPPKAAADQTDSRFASKLKIG